MWERLPNHLKGKKAFSLDEKQIPASYERCFGIGVDPGLERLTDLLEGAALEDFLARYAPAITASRALFSEVYRMLPDLSCAFVLTDATGRIIEFFSVPEVVFGSANQGILPGASFSEESCGTNAVALALIHCRPIIVKGRQHFCRLFHDWYCAAAPVFDAGGKLAGCVDFSTGHEAGIGEKLPLVAMLAEKLSVAFPSENGVTPKASLSDPLSPLFSPQQRRILAMVANGLTSKEIGAALAISARTVETHLERMRIRAKARTTAQLVALAFRPDRISVQPPLSFHRNGIPSVRKFSTLSRRKNAGTINSQVRPTDSIPFSGDLFENSQSNPFVKGDHDGKQEQSQARSGI